MDRPVTPGTRFRLWGCGCGWRTWTTDTEPEPTHRCKNAPLMEIAVAREITEETS